MDRRDTLPLRAGLLYETRTVLASYLLLFTVAFALALVCTPLVRAAALRFEVVDHGGGRRVHSGRVPRLGGVALLLAAGGTLALAPRVGIAVGDVLEEYGWNLPALAAGALIVLALGVADDVRGVGPGLKIAVQVLAAVVAMRGGYGVEALTNPFTGGYIWLSSLGGAVTLLWIVGVTNGFNLIDGLDGLAAGTGLIAAATLFFVALVEARPDTALLAAILAGALTGFLRFNFSPASIFLGDSGSLLIGYVLSVLSIQSLQKGTTAVVLLVPILTLGLPLIEAGVTVVRRGLVAGIASVFKADREHIHHRLLALGMTPRNAVLLLYGVGVALGGLALLAITVRGALNGAIVGGVALATWAGIRKLGYRRR
jgi:UDP-GlcNAc:undecaprenyl-phosphate GlcNAc-1-phosphate transferase